ncbi:hypothetical protein ACSTHD_23570, partial [Vibrio parahaemolyticus]
EIKSAHVANAGAADIGASAHLAPHRKRRLHERMTEPALHILVIDADRLRASIIQEGLRDAGHFRVTILEDMRWLMRSIVEIDPDVI